MSESPGRRRSGGRARIARALGGGPKTIPQVAALLDTTDGALRAAVNGMERDGQIARVEPRVERGQRWQLTAAGRRELLEALAPGIEPGVLLPGQRLLVLVDQGQGVTPAAWDALADEAGSLQWAARLDGNALLLLALDGNDPVAADRVRARLAAAGMSSVAGRVSETLEPRALYGRRAPAISS